VSATSTLNRFLGATVGTLYSAFTGKADPWTLAAQVEENTAAIVTAAQKECAQYPEGFVGPKPPYCDPNYATQVQAQLTQDQQATVKTPDQPCAAWDIFCLFFNSPGWKKFVTNFWIVAIIAVFLFAIVAGAKIKTLGREIAA
jgi:hypothetical protein